MTSSWQMSQGAANKKAITEAANFFEFLTWETSTQLHKCSLDVPGGEGFRNVCALLSSCGGMKQVIPL